MGFVPVGSYILWVRASGTRTHVDSGAYMDAGAYVDSGANIYSSAYVDTGATNRYPCAADGYNDGHADARTNCHSCAHGHPGASD